MTITGEERGPVIYSLSDERIIQIQQQLTYPDKHKCGLAALTLPFRCQSELSAILCLPLILDLVDVPLRVCVCACFFFSLPTFFSASYSAQAALRSSSLRASSSLWSSRESCS